MTSNWCDRNDVEGNDSEEKIRKYVGYCYSTSQLMHIYHTNFEIIETLRGKLESLLIDRLLENRKSVIEEENNSKATFDDFRDDEWLNKFFKSNLNYIVIDTCIKFLEKDNRDLDVKSSWEKICKAFFKSCNDSDGGRNSSELNETICTMI